MTLTARDETLTKDLDRLRRTHAGMDALVYLDFKAGTVLCVSAAADHPQEVFDELCSLCAETFTDLQPQTTQAMVVTLTEVLVLQRSSRTPGTSLCLILDPEIPLDEVRKLAQQALSQLEL
ncbi:hypothetical protein [Tropicimonas aquimaris]|uniref:Roadblock/LAMTOR2 domain-containing protein n=1 Tax=Tropicimonas aquimaris TaxID=914152 RepID=A0ABW3IU05_9RHOB